MDDSFDPAAQGSEKVTFVCRSCHHSFQAEKKSEAPRSFLARLFGGGGGRIACPKCGSKELSEADTAPLTTKAYRKKQQAAQDSAPKP